MEKAFRGGQGDFIHLQGPAPQQLERDSVGKVVAALGDAVPPVAFSSLMANREFLATPQAAAFKRAYLRSLRFVIQSPAREIADIEAQFFPGVSVDAIASAISRYQQLGTWRSDPNITREQYEVAMDIFIFAGTFKERYAYDDVVVQY
jgi:NitT/TauT family transport system substrate-binding protein